MEFNLEKAAGHAAKRDKFEKITKRKLGEGDELPTEPDSVQEILQDPERKDHFADLLRNIDTSGSKDVSTGLFSRLAKQEALTKEDNALLERGRYELVLRTKDVEKITKDISDSDFLAVLERNDDIRQMMGALPEHRRLEVMREALPSVAMSEPKFLKDFMQTLDRVKKTREGKEYNMLKVETERVCKQYKFSEEDFGSLGPARDIASRDRTLKMIKERMGFFAKSVDLFSRGRYSGSGAEQLLATSEKMKGSRELKDLSKGLDKIGSVLAATISKNQNLLRAITTEVVTGEEKQPEEKAAEFSSLEDVNKKARRFDAKDITGRLWDAEKTRLERVHNKTWDKFNPAEKDTGKTDYLNRMKQEPFERRGGLLGMFFAALIAVWTSAIDKRSLK